MNQKISRRRLIQTGSLAFGASLAPAALTTTWAQTPTPAQASLPTGVASALSGPDRLNKLVEMGKKEGSVTIYSSMPMDDMTALTSEFEKRYGIKTKVWRAGSENILQRVVLESKANKNEVDLIDTNGPEMEAMHREHILQVCQSPFLADLIPAAILPHREWIASRLNIFTLAYNTKVLKKADLPKSYAELLDPKWKGKLAVEANDDDWLAGTVTQMGYDKGVALFKEIANKNGVTVRKGHTLLANLVASGEVPIALTLYNYKVEQMKNAGAPMDWFALEPTIARPNGVGVNKNAPHPYAAVLFQDFILSVGQSILSKRDFIPTNTKVPSTLNKMPLVFADPKVTLDDNAKWSRLYDEIFSHRGGV
jgi:iron(III) transport system substrate-binding protein